MAGAKVQITNLGTNETRTTQSGSAGTYAFPNLNAGVYRVEVEMQGFKRFTQDRVEVQVDVATRVDPVLPVGNVTESVLVTTEAPPLQTDSASLGTTIGQKEVESIPLSGRNVNNMLTLVPGVVAQGGTYGGATTIMSAEPRRRPPRSRRANIARHGTSRADRWRSWSGATCARCSPHRRWLCTRWSGLAADTGCRRRCRHDERTCAAPGRGCTSR